MSILGKIYDLMVIRGAELNSPFIFNFFIKYSENINSVNIRNDSEYIEVSELFKDYKQYSQNDIYNDAI